MTETASRRDLSRIETESHQTAESGSCHNDEWPDTVTHGRPTNVGDDVLIGDTEAYVARIEDDVVYLNERDGDGEYVVPREIVPSHTVSNPLNG
ncbi:hypothetical protein [Salarchaeum sp. JOR-1]|uniref:hypothetical protein n=1 Tax=Salarchaeum sp. JOR-1 TaxID=2599399 RepID=UPI00119855C4|nr:hypothetical protein [Salarchaeum sp. JOR-1]QDX40854.1 hypothetical protein FQU85_08050 [Salarchaeum sp. JOR-1]